MHIPVAWDWGPQLSRIGEHQSASATRQHCPRHNTVLRLRLLIGRQSAKCMHGPCHGPWLQRLCTRPVRSHARFTCHIHKGVCQKKSTCAKLTPHGGIHGIHCSDHAQAAGCCCNWLHGNVIFPHAVQSCFREPKKRRAWGQSGGAFQGCCRGQRRHSSYLEIWPAAHHTDLRTTSADRTDVLHPALQTSSRS